MIHLPTHTRIRPAPSVSGVRVADDLVQRQFRPTWPNVLWVADITYLRTWEGGCTCARQDTLSRRIVGWSMADHMRSDLVVDALRMAIARRQPEAGLIHNSDQSRQFVKPRVRPAAGKAGMGRARVYGSGAVAHGSADGSPQRVHSPAPWRTRQNG